MQEDPLTHAPVPAPRPPRADALRNRGRILAAASEAFTARGADVSMDDVAKTAGVGAGTLYRNFPNREALLEAVYREGLERLAHAEVGLSQALPPVEALRAWLLLFVDYIEAKKLILPAINAIIADQAALFDCSGTTLIAAATRLIRRAVDSGDLRDTIQPIDLLWAIYGASSSPTPNWAEGARRVVDILIQGCRRLP